MSVYREVVTHQECQTQKEAYEYTVAHEAPRFYVDSRWAYQRIAPLTRGDRSGLDRMNPLRRAMYEELFDVVQRLYQKEKFSGRPLAYVLQYAIQEPASRFYISVNRMGQIWNEKTRRRKPERHGL